MSFEEILNSIISEKLDKVNKDAVMKKFANRKDKDIDNDGDVDDTDRYLHTRRKAITKAMKKESVGLNEKVNEKAIKKAVDDGKSMDVILSMFANKRATNTDEIQHVLRIYT